MNRGILPWGGYPAVLPVTLNDAGLLARINGKVRTAKHAPVPAKFKSRRGPLKITLDIPFGVRSIRCFDPRGCGRVGRSSLLDTFGHRKPAAPRRADSAEGSALAIFFVGASEARRPLHAAAGRRRAGAVRRRAEPRRWTLLAATGMQRQSTELPCRWAPLRRRSSAPWCLPQVRHDASAKVR